MREGGGRVSEGGCGGRVWGEWGRVSGRGCGGRESGCGGRESGCGGERGRVSGREGRVRVGGVRGGERWGE